MFCITMVNQIHKWTHSIHVPYLVKILQNANIIVSKQYHKVHHLDESKNYSLFSGHVEIFLDYFKFYHWIEIIIFLFTGIAAIETRIGLKTGEGKNFFERWKIVKEKFN